MKIVYFLVNPSHSGGIERVICQKANYLAEKYCYDVTIITTDKGTQKNAFDFSSKIKFINLDINYGELDGLSIWKRLTQQIKKRKKHKNKLTEVLGVLKPDICISVGYHDVTILPQIKNVGKKIVEFHFSKQYMLIEYKHSSKSFLLRVFFLLGEYRKRFFLKKYDAFVVLTEEDKKKWGEFTNILSIPNPLSHSVSHDSSLCQNKKVISVGRLTTQKGFSYLINAWRILKEKNNNDWVLNIFGKGEDFDVLNDMICEYGLEDSIFLRGYASDIYDEYINSSICIMSSLYEGFPMVLLEATSCGLPCVSFNCPTGPSEILKDGEDGFLVKEGDVEDMAMKVLLLIENEGLRQQMGVAAKKNSERFHVDNVMPLWIDLFKKILEKKA